MLSWPDFVEKQIVYIKSKEVKNLAVRNNNLVVKEDNKLLNQISLAKLFAVFVVGEATFTSVLIKKILDNGIVLLFMNRNLKPYCTIGGETEGNVLLRKKQYQDFLILQKSKALIINKIENQTVLLKRLRTKNKKIKGTIENLVKLAKNIEKAKDKKSVLGFEGRAARIFFEAYFGKFNWHGRKPRTKFDEKNTLLDIGYTFLFNFIEANLRLYGFDLYCGFLHTEFYQRKSLVCDLMEPFRCIVEHALHRMLALKKFDEYDFKVRKGGYYLKFEANDKYAKEFLESIMERKEDIFKYMQSFYRGTIKEENDFPKFNI